MLTLNALKRNVHEFIMGKLKKKELPEMNLSLLSESLYPIGILSDDSYSIIGIFNKPRDTDNEIKANSLRNCLISITKAYCDILFYRNLSNSVNAMVVLFISEYHFHSKDKVLIENANKVKDINLFEDIYSKTKEALFIVLQQKIEKENVDFISHSLITATHFFNRTFPSEDNRILHNILFKYNNTHLSLMHSLPDTYHISLNDFNQSQLNSPIEISLNSPIALNGPQQTYEGLYIKSLIIQQEGYANENIDNLRESSLSELPREVREEMNRLKQVKFTMKQFNAFNQQKK